MLGAFICKCFVVVFYLFYRWDAIWLGGGGVKSFDLGGIAVAWLSYFLLIKVSEILCIFRDFSDRSYFLSHNLLLH